MKLQKAIITFSFDDGHPNDLRLAKLLKKYSLKATFYIPIRNSENPVMNPSQIRRLYSMGFEVGSHGLTHRRLTLMSFEEARGEVFSSKTKLEKILGAGIESYCFAGGKYHRQHLPLIAEAGYHYSRTTRLLRQYQPLEKNLMHTTMQYYPLSTLGYVKHLLRRPDRHGWLLFLQSIQRCGINASPDTLANYFISKAIQDKACFHMHGHSYEFQSENDWKVLEKLFDYSKAQRNCEFLNNSQAFRKLTDGGGVA